MNVRVPRRAQRYGSGCRCHGAATASAHQAGADLAYRPRIARRGQDQPIHYEIEVPTAIQCDMRFDTAQGAPPLGTPPTDWPGLEPISVDTTPPSSATAVAVSNPATSTVGNIFKTIRVSCIMVKPSLMRN